MTYTAAERQRMAEIDQQLKAAARALPCEHDGQRCAGRAGDCLCPCFPCRERWAGYAAAESAPWRNRTSEAVTTTGKEQKR